MITMPAGSEEPELVRRHEADEQMRTATETRERREQLQLRMNPTTVNPSIVSFTRQADLGQAGMTRVMSVSIGSDHGVGCGPPLLGSQAGPGRNMMLMYGTDLAVSWVRQPNISI